MSTTKNQTIKNSGDLEKTIDRAIKKVHGSKENDLCKYLPGPSGGYMHHFTMKKLKKTNPAQLDELLQEFVVASDQPKALDPKPRAPRGSRKRRDIISFTRTDIERVLELAREAGDKDLLSKFSPKRSMPALKRELIRSIRENRLCPELWTSYCECIAALEATSQLD